MKDGVTLTQGYSLDLDKVNQGSVIGIKRHDDASLHYYLDGVDMGEACGDIPERVYPCIDLYGRCAQVNGYMRYYRSFYLYRVAYPLLKSVITDFILNHFQVSIVRGDGVLPGPSQESHPEEGPISPQESVVTAAGPIPANLHSQSETTVTVSVPNSNPHHYLHK